MKKRKIIIQDTYCNMFKEKCFRVLPLSKIEEVMGVVDKGGQFQLIIGPQVSTLYDEVIKLVTPKEIIETKEKKMGEKKSFKSIINTIFDYLAGSLTPLIPVFLAASLCKTIAAIVGPSLLGLTVAAALIIGFIVMFFMKLDENIN